MKGLISTLVFLLTGFQIWAQQGENITIYTITNQQVEPASRILEHPKIIDSVKATAVKDYPLLFFQAETKILLDTIEAATVASAVAVEVSPVFRNEVVFAALIALSTPFAVSSAACVA